MAHAPKAGITLRVLLADRDDRRRGELRQSMAAAGYLVVGEVEDGDQALALASSLRPDVAVVDAQLPHVSGIDLAHQLDRLGIAPTAIISTSQQPGFIRKAIQAGAMAVYVTPVSAASLVANLPVAVQAWRSEQKCLRRLGALADRLRTRDAVAAAKVALMSWHGISEDEAYCRLRRSSMNSRQPMRRIAEAVLDAVGASDAALPSLPGAA